MSRRLLPLIGLLSLALVTANAAQAQTVSCTGVPAWSASTVYNPGDRVVYQNALYQVNTPIWNAPPTYCPSCGWYTLLGTCGGTTTDTTPPSVPSGLFSPSKTSSSVSLAWNASTDSGGSGLAGYDVYRNGASVGSTSATSFTASGLAASTTYSFTVRARDNAGNASAQSGAVSVTTDASSGGQAPYGGSARSIPGTIQAEDYDTGGEGVAFHDTTGGNSGGQYRSDAVDIETTTDSGGGTNVGWIDAGEWLEYTVSVASSGSYTLEARVASLSTGGTLHVEMDGSNVSGTVTLPSTGGWQNWTTVSRTVTLAAGSHVMRLAMDSAGFNVNWLRFTSGTTPSCNTLPSVPSGLTSPSKTSSSVSLSWNASSPGANCTVSYRVFRNGTQVTQVSTTNATVSGLAASTTYSFTVAAVNQFGSSAESSAISVTTNSGTTPTGSPRFAPYVDISLATGSQVAANAAAAQLPGITLAFLVDGGCQAVWAGGLGNVSNATFPNGTTVRSQIDALIAAGTRVIISWGGATGSVLSSCGSASQAQAMYQSAFNAYPNISGLDFDIEGGVNTSILAQALAGLKAANPSKSISLTLPVLPIGLVQAGLDIVNACHNAGFHPDTINIMAMDYGSYYDNGGNMLLSAQQAAQATRNQTGDMIGITPMIGQNDVQGEIFTLSNASSLVSWARGQSYINRLAFWSLSRDNGSCAGQTWASPICSGVSQSTWQFSSIFRAY